MSKYYVQVAIVKEHCVEADDELQAERAAFQAEPDNMNIIGMKVFGVADEYDGAGALAGDELADMAELRTFNHVNRSWCEKD